MIYGQKQLSNNITGKNFFFDLKPIKAWRAIFGLALAISISLLIGGPIAIITFPLGSLTLGWFLYRRYPLFYCSFTWWMWFVGPVIRRIIDLRCGYFTPGPWHLAPMLVTSISLLTVFKYLPKAHKQRGLPFVIAAASCLYGYLLNLNNEGLADIDQSTFLVLSWLAPIAFGFHLSTHWRDYPSYRQNLQRTFLWGVLFMGFYGMVQYVFAPPWDVFWLKTMIAESKALSFGTPEPFGIRVFSSMGAPQDFAAMILAGLILLFSVRGSQQMWVNALGFLSFLLSLARQAWLGLFVTIFIFFRALKSNLQVRMLISIVILVLIILPVTMIEPFSTTIGERIETMDDTDSDGSFRSRIGAFNLLIGHALVELVGYGLQNPIQPNVEVSKGYVLGDNGILVILFALGWIGATPYILSLAGLIFQIQQACLKNEDILLQATYAIILGQLSQVFFKNLFVDTTALILWGFAGIGMSASNYYRNSRFNDTNSPNK